MFYRSPAGPPVPRSPISAVPPCYPEWGAAVACDARPQPGVGQRALHEPAATPHSQPHASTPVPAGDTPGKVTSQPPATTIANSEESPWRRRSSFEPQRPESPFEIDDADLPVSEVWPTLLDFKTCFSSWMLTGNWWVNRSICLLNRAVSQTPLLSFSIQVGVWTALLCQRQQSLLRNPSACLLSQLQWHRYWSRIDVKTNSRFYLFWIKFSSRALFYHICGHKDFCKPLCAKKYK